MDGITLYLDQYRELFLLGPGEVIYRLFFWYFGWLPVAIAFVYGAIQLWLYWRQSIFYNQQKWISLAVDIPHNIEQSPKAVENLFAYLHGAHRSINLIEKWWEGQVLYPFSFEIVSIEGYIQFLIYLPAQFKDYVMTGVYAQYPEAEITEVEDYTHHSPDRFPDDEWDMWGAEFIETKPFPYPFKLYREFEHQMGPPEMQYKDPMASLMDTMSSLRRGEQIWYQIVITPGGFEWHEECDKEISKIIGEKTKAKTGMFMKLVETIGDWSEYIIPIWKDIEPKKDDGEDTFKIMNLKPEQKKQIEAIQEKKAKIGFETKIRMIYLARKEVMNKPKGVNGFVGYMKQFTANDLNSWMPDVKKTATSAAYLRAEPRVIRKKNKLLNAYKSRSNWLGRTPTMLNIEELATLWHFPLDAVVKAPMIQRSASRKVEAPMALPTDERPADVGEVEPIFDEKYEIEEEPAAEPKERPQPEAEPGEKPEDIFEDEEDEDKGEAPSNLPFAE